MRQIVRLYPRFVAFLGLCRITLDKKRGLFAVLSKDTLFVHTNQNERNEIIWKRDEKHHIFALSKQK